jgi:hypothetical protein
MKDTKRAKLLLLHPPPQARGRKEVGELFVSFVIFVVRSKFSKEKAIRWQKLWMEFAYST